MSMKNPLTLAGIEPATFRFVAQHLNHCATAVPKHFSYFYEMVMDILCSDCYYFICSCGEILNLELNKRI